MAVLEEKKQEDIDHLREKANEYWDTDKCRYFDLLIEAWNLYPEPKDNWNEAYSLAKELFSAYLLDADFSNAKKWLNAMIANNNKLQHFYGDLEFNIGKYKFETGLYSEALEYFMIATKEGGGMRYFEDEDKKYREFYKSPEKIQAGLTRGRNKTEVRLKYEFVE